MNCFKQVRNYQQGYRFEFSAVTGPRGDFPSNEISTSRYNLVTFLPLALAAQFNRLANVYFLVIAILQSIPILSPFGPLTAWGPLIVVIGISLIRQAIEDMARHRSDHQLNSSPCTRFIDGQFRSSNWTDVRVGDFIRVVDNQFFPADMIVLNSGLESGVCFIETAALDGQKTLKRKLANKDTVQSYTQNMHNFKGQFDCQKPNDKLYNFSGKMRLREQKNLQIGYNNAQALLLRGAKLKNSKWVVGLVVYVGDDSRVMRNSNEPRIKTSQVQERVNFMLAFVFVFQLALCLLCAIGDGVFYTIVWSDHSWYIPPAVGQSVILQGVVNFFSHIVLFNTMIPISLVVSIQIVKTVQAMMLGKDVLMVSQTTKKTAHAFSSSVNQQLGQISYVFSDKTGTLTCNIMEFKMCVLAGQLYGDKTLLFKNQPEMKRDYSFQDPALQQLMKKNTQIPLRHPIQLKYRGSDKIALVYKTLNQLSHDFFFGLSVAHQCMRQFDQIKREYNYQGQSPDQITLVAAASSMGYTYLKNSMKDITIKRGDKQIVYELLQSFPFDSDRKRMSVVLRVDGKLRMFIKGADSIIIKRLTNNPPSSYLPVVDQYLTQFSRIGLRTLLLGTRIISEEEYKSFKAEESKLPQTDRQALRWQLVSKLEQDITLIGATAVQDKLQPNLLQTIRDLLRAQIKVWMLTGDKMETAQNIARSCSLIQPSFKVFRYEKKATQVATEYLDTMINQMNYTQQQGLSKAFLLQGQSLADLLSNAVTIQQLVQIAKLCEVVVCCRVSPKQKAQVVALVKSKLGKITLAIGDGANDVNMIQQAHIGVGLYGQEGMRAVQASDYALPQFQHLWRLLLVHGRWNYLRISEMVLYFFYKNIVFTIPQFYFAFFCAFSGQTFFDQTYVALYNLIFTSLPLVIRALFQQDLNYIVEGTHGKTNSNLPLGFVENYSLKRLYPKFYWLGQKNTVFNSRNFAIWFGQGLLIGLVITIWSIFSLQLNVLSYTGKTLPNFALISTTAYSTVIVIVTVKLATHTRFWSLGYFLVISLTGLLIYFLWLLISNTSLTISNVAYSISTYLTTAQTYMVVIFCLLAQLAFDGLALYIRDKYLDPTVGLVRQTISKNPDFTELIERRIQNEENID